MGKHFLRYGRSCPRRDPLDSYPFRKIFRLEEDFGPTDLPHHNRESVYYGQWRSGDAVPTCDFCPMPETGERNLEFPTDLGKSDIRSAVLRSKLPQRCLPYFFIERLAL